MDEQIRFIEHKLASSFLDMLQKKRVLQKITCDFLRLVFAHGGYIAGGFGTIVARCVVLNEPSLKIEDSPLYNAIREHLGNPQRDEPSKTSMLGDIDVWFPDETSLLAFQTDPALNLLLSVDSLVKVSNTVTGFATEYLIENDAKIQVIHHFLLPLQEQLSRFDIYNGMVGLTNDAIVVPEHWEVLERERVLHVHVWKTPWTINRFFKWVRRKDYKHVTPVTAESLADEVTRTLDWFKEHGSSLPPAELEAAVHKNVLLKHVAWMPNRIQQLLAPIMSSLSAERLLELSMLFRPSRAGYDLALHEIHRRMPAPIPIHVP